MDDYATESWRNSSLVSVEQHLDVSMSRYGLRGYIYNRVVLTCCPAIAAEAKRRVAEGECDLTHSRVIEALDFVQQLDLGLHNFAADETITDSTIWHHRAQSSIESDKVDRALISREAVEQCAADYLARPWLQSPRLEWAMVDSLVHYEVTTFSEHLVFQEGMAGLQSPMLAIVGRILARTIDAATVLVPAWWIMREFDRSNSNAVWWLLAFIAYLVWWGWGWRRNFQYLRSPEHPKRKNARLLHSMRIAYHELNGPVLDPSRVQEKLRAAEQDGVVWPLAIWPILAKAIERDARAWPVWAN